MGGERQEIRLDREMGRGAVTKDLEAIGGGFVYPKGRGKSLKDFKRYMSGLRLDFGQFTLAFWRMDVERATQETEINRDLRW